MSWNPRVIAGLVMSGDIHSFGTFTDYRGYVSLNNEGYSGVDAPVYADFAYDDTLGGRVPDGVVSRQASCANALYQPVIYPVRYLGADAPNPQESAAVGGHMTSFSCQLAGGEVEVGDDQLSAAAGHLVTLGGALPRAFAKYAFDVPGSGTQPLFYLLRPVALRWPGQDPGNDANRTLWQPSEINGPVAYQFTVLAQSAFIAREWTGRGFRPA